MDSSFIIILAIIILFLILCLTIIVLIIYSGLFHNIKILYGEPPVTSLSFMYKIGSGPYQNSTDIFAEAAAIAPNLYPIGIYFDDPYKDKNLRWLAGSVLDGDIDEPMAKLFEENKFKKCDIGKIKKCVWTTFPFTFTFSIPIAIYRVYPALISYIKKKELEAHPMVEIYTKEGIHFLAITENQEKFYIPDILSTQNIENESNNKNIEKKNISNDINTCNNRDNESYYQNFINEDAVNNYLIETTDLNSEKENPAIFENEVMWENPESDTVPMVENFKEILYLSGKDHNSVSKIIKLNFASISLIEDNTKSLCCNGDIPDKEPDM